MEASTHILLFILGWVVIFAAYIIAPIFKKNSDKEKDKDV